MGTGGAEGRDASRGRRNAEAHLDRAIDRAVSAAMGLKGDGNEQPRSEIVRGIAGLAAAERELGLSQDPEERFRYVAGLAESDEPGNVAATEVIEALSP